MRARTALLPWAAFVLVHLALIALCLYGPGEPHGDVDWVYRNWAEAAASGGPVPGITVPFVYPVLAFVPMLAAWLLAPDAYALGWLGLVTVVDAVAFAALLGRRPLPRRVAAAWWWLGFLLLQGPTALARIDAVAVAIVIVALTVLERHPSWGGALLTVAAWVKVWPAVLVAALLVACRRRVAVLDGAVAGSVVVVAVALALGSGWTVLSFITQQTGRGIQIEAPVAAPWLWQAALSPAGPSLVYYDRDILTFQVMGPGTTAVSALMTPLLGLVAVGILAAGWWAKRRRAPIEALLPPLALALTVALIAFNKVGSPQFISWLAAPVLLGIVLLGRRFRLEAVLVAALAALTQLVYPYLYDWLLAGNPLMVALLTARNLLEFVVLGIAVHGVWTAGRRGSRLEGAAAHRSPRP